MSERAIELLNELLKVFNQDDSEYKILIGDKSKSTDIDYDIVGGDQPYDEFDFNNITDAVNISDILIIQSNTNEMFLNVGDYKWKSTDNPGATQTYIGQNVGTLGGNVTITLPLGSVWLKFADGVNDGLKIIELPTLGIGSMIIGSTFVVA